MGDGNFHLQLRAQSKGIDRDPSLFGDNGFFAKRETEEGYIKCAESDPAKEAKVSTS